MSADGCCRGGDAARADASRLSFEFFPPKTAKLEADLWHAIERLAPFGPDFVSVTYGAGGGTRDRTHTMVARIRRDTAIAPAAHLTCVGAGKVEITAVAERYWQAGVRHIVALRGDPPAAADGLPGRFQPEPAGFAGSVELIAGLKALADFEISAAVYPEPHPDSLGRDADLDHIKRKIDAGASRLITQYFFDNDVFLGLLDRVRGAGIATPIVPGLMPIVNFAQIVRFSAACGTTVPAWLHRRFAGLDQDPTGHFATAVSTAAEQCAGLRAAGVRDFHFYTLNRAELASAILHCLGVAPPVAARRVS